MTLIELQAKLEADLKIDPSKLLDETSSNLNLHAQYFSNLLRARIELKRQQIAMRELEKDRYNYYAGFAPDVYEYNLDARAIKFNLEGDKEILNMQKTITMLEIKLEFFAKACDLFKDRGFAIKNQIDLLKFQSGA